MENIERDEEEFVAVTCPNTRSFYSIRSTGEFCVIEVCKVSCSCESCLYNEGKECPNQSYALDCKAIKIVSGKLVLQDNFLNIHWHLNAKKTKAGCDRNANSNTSTNLPDADVPLENEWKWKQSTNNRQPPKQTHRSQKVNWDEIYQVMQGKYTYSDIESFVESVDKFKFQTLYRPIMKLPRYCNIEKVAFHHLSEDCPKNDVPIVTTGNSNSLPRALSLALFGVENYHKEIHLRIVMEGITKREYYIDNDYLSNGATLIHSRRTFPQQYALFSGQYFHPVSGNINDIVNIVYKKELLSVKTEGSFMGMWQLWTTSNILQRPIMSVFFQRGSKSFCLDFNRILIPIDERFCSRERLYIMWTPVTPNGEIIHFVPLFKKNTSKGIVDILQSYVSYFSHCIDVGISFNTGETF